MGEDQKQYWLIASWKWWRYNHEYSFIKSFKLTVYTDIWMPIFNAYCSLTMCCWPWTCIKHRELKNLAHKLKGLNKLGVESKDA